MTPFLMIFLHLIPIVMTIWIFLAMICLTILLRGSPRAVMMLLSAWLAWRLKSNGAGAWRQKPLRVSPLL